MVHTPRVHRSRFRSRSMCSHRHPASTSSLRITRIRGAFRKLWDRILQWRRVMGQRWKAHRPCGMSCLYMGRHSRSIQSRTRIFRMSDGRNSAGRCWKEYMLAKYHDPKRRHYEDPGLKSAPGLSCRRIDSISNLSGGVLEPPLFEF
jgi:hypothetical protein